VSDRKVSPPLLTGPQKWIIALLVIGIFLMVVLAHLVPTTTSPSDLTGGVVMVNHGRWVCGSSKEAHDEITKWVVLKDNEEMLQVMRRTNSFALPDGYQVKILDRGFATTKVRVLGWLDPDDGKIHAYPEDNRIGRECWVTTEAVNQ